MDPPYNINFRSNFQGLVNDTNVGEKWDDIPMDVRSVKAFRDSYQDGIHSYLDQLRTQLIHGRELLKDSGSFVMQIGADNLHYVAVLMSEVFGHENHVATIPYISSFNQSAKHIPEVNNWLIWFSKDHDKLQSRQIIEETSIKEKLNNWSTCRVQFSNGDERPLTQEERSAPEIILSQGARIWDARPATSEHISMTGRSDVYYHHPKGPCDNAGWTHQERIEQKLAQAHVDHHCVVSQCKVALPDNWSEHNCSKDCHTASGTRLCPLGRKCGSRCSANAVPCPAGRQWRVSLAGLHAIAMQGRLNEENLQNLTWKRFVEDQPGRRLNAVWSDAGRTRYKNYIVETPPTVLQRVLLMTTDPGDLVLDPTCGSGAMPLMAERWGRRWIAIDASAVSIAVARERIATAIHDYHLLQDSPEGHRREHELAQNLLPQDKRVPFTPKAKYGNDPAKGFVLERQWRISAATLAYGFDGETPIYHPDRPHAANGKNRVSSAFTVESDMPFSSMQPNAPETNGSSTHPGSIETMRNIEQSLQESGIRAPAVIGDAPRTYRVTDLEPTVEIADATHIGRIAEGAGEARDAVFYICQEDEVAGPFQTRNLAVVARNRSASYACVIGFGHEGDSETIARQQGNITLLKVVANRDLMIPGLEHKSNDNAFVVISEPDLEFHDEPDGQVSIEVQGLTAYNPATGQVEPAGDRKIAGILTDTDYDQESFRVCLMNLPQTGQVAERRLKQIRDAFRREIDDAKWKRMRSSRTLPFGSPGPGGKIAVKVIDHTGVEHMKVLDAP